MMVKVTHKELNETVEVDRLLGRISHGTEGPTAVFLCGTHGNETSGVFGVKRVLKELEEKHIPVKGELIAAFSGNLRALQEGVRFIDKDLNRGWVTDRMKKLGFMTEEDEMWGHEKKEQQELIDILQKVIGRAKGEVFVFDLHTTSSVSPPFCAISDTIRNRRIAVQVPVPTVVGFDEQTKGTFMNYVNEMGLTGVAFEAGEHFAAASVENQVSFIWMILSIIGCIDGDKIEEFDKHYSNLAKANFGQHKIFDLVYHHEIKEEDQFKMRPGYTTFDKIEKGEHIADDTNGPLRAPEAGNIFMPLYQKQGEDGYFIVAEKSKEWLDLSERMRLERDDEYLLNLPGVEQHPDDQHTLIIEEERYFEIRDRLHLMGYRRHRPLDGKIMITRRVYDVKAPQLKDKKVYEE